MIGLETRALQAAVALACLVPIAGGGAGVLWGPQAVGGTAGMPPDLDSHLRYLSGLLLAIGIGYAAAVPGIARHRGRFRLLGGIVVVGGLGRLASVLAIGLPSPTMRAALAMELVVTPALTLWQGRVARLAGVAE